MKRVFIGSSSEALPQAEEIALALSGCDNIEPLLWTEVFQPGLLTFEAIEKASRSLVGAILLATPDDLSVIRDREVRVPRANVMIEFGYLTGLLGRHRIALCVYDGVELATDLSGMTYIPVHTPLADPIAHEHRKKIIAWAESLPAVGAGLQLAEVWHGYTGRWSVDLNFARWRNHSVVAPDYAHLEGVAYLLIPRTGSNGVGSIHGDLYVNMAGGSVPYLRIAVAAEVDGILCDSDGSLGFSSRIRSRQFRELEGDFSALSIQEQEYQGPRRGSWTLFPSAGVLGRLDGRFSVGTTSVGSDEATATLLRTS